MMRCPTPSLGPNQHSRKQPKLGGISQYRKNQKAPMRSPDEALEEAQLSLGQNCEDVLASASWNSTHTTTVAGLVERLKLIMAYAFMTEGAAVLNVPEGFVDDKQDSLRVERRAFWSTWDSQLTNPQDRAVIASLSDVTNRSSAFSCWRNFAKRLGESETLGAMAKAMVISNKRGVCFKQASYQSIYDPTNLVSFLAFSKLLLSPLICKGWDQSDDICAF
eukprot:g16164.t1